jgi:hypothetical protein
MLCIVAAVIWLVPITGCGLDSAQRLDIAERALAVVERESAKLDERLEALDTFLVTSRAALADPNTTDELAEKIIAGIDKAQAEFARIQEVKPEVDQVTRDLRAKIAALQAGGDVDFTSELQVVATLLGSTGTAIGGETGQWLKIAAMVLSALVTLLGGLGLREHQGKMTATTALSEVIAGGQKFKAKVRAAPEPLSGEAAVTAFKAEQGTAQKTPATKKLVAALKVDCA